MAGIYNVHFNHSSPPPRFIFSPTNKFAAAGRGGGQKTPVTIFEFLTQKDGF